MKFMIPLALLCVLAGPVFAQHSEGEIRGVLVNEKGQPQPAQRIELRRLGGRSERYGKTTDLNGEFVYTGLATGRYVAEVRRDSRVIATSRTILVSEEMRVVADVLVAPPGPPVVPPLWQRRTSADKLLRGRPIPSSFGALSSVLQIGHQVIVTDRAGRRSRGRVSSLSGDHLVIFQEASTPAGRLLVRAKELTFPQDTITRIDMVDPTWNGILIAAATVPGIVYGIYRWDRYENGVSLSTPFFAILSIPLALGAGQLIDWLRNNDAVYIQAAAPLFTIAPLLRRERVGLIAQLHF